MTDATNGFGSLTEPATLTITRLLPGPIERIWAFITDGEKRRLWLASGPMDTRVGAPFELVWRNDEISKDSAARPEGFSAESRMKSLVTECDPPHRLSFTWDNTGDVTFQLEEQGRDVMLTITHRRLPDRGHMLGISAGWHAHLDILVARANDEIPPSFWEHWVDLRQQYDQRIPA